MGETPHNPHQHFFPLDGVSQQHPSEVMAEMGKVELCFGFNPVMAKPDVQGEMPSISI